MNERVKELIIMVLIGVLSGAFGASLVLNGKLPAKVNISNQGLQTQTVIQEDNAVISAVEKTSSSVVAIGVTQRVINPFDPFAAPTQQQSTIGTGFFVSDKQSLASSRGVIVTNRHVVLDPGVKYTVVTKDGKKLDVTKIYRDPNLDLAIIAVSDTSFKPLELGDSSKLKVGQTVIAIGNALGRFDNTVTTGVVSGLSRAVTAGDPFLGGTEKLDNLIQTDAAINPGNSGGPLLNLAGQVIGVNVATTEGAQNIGFAIPINSVKAIVDEFVRTGSVSRPFLGIRYRFVSRDVAILNEVPQGAYVQEVVTDSPADKAGIKAGEIITKIDGRGVNSESIVSQTIQSKKVGDSVSLEIWSDGKTRQVTASLVQSPNQ